MVSKPVAPPWNDSSKNLVHDLARSLTRHDPIVLTRRGVRLELPRGRTEGLYAPSSGSFAPPLVDNARVLGRLLFGKPAELWHFFFAPNPRTSAAGRLASSVRGRRTIQTLCSVPGRDLDRRILYFADRIVALSVRTEALLHAHRVGPERVVRIPPGIEPVEPLRAVERKRFRVEFGLPAADPVIVFPGDLEFGAGAAVTLDSFARVRPRDGVLVLACRAKTARASGAQAELRDRARELGVTERVRWVGETRDILGLLGAADVIVLPSVSLVAKMDYPLVLLEAMSLGRVVIVAEGTSAAELAADGCAVTTPAEPDAIAVQLEVLLGDDAARARIGGAARKRVLERFSRQSMASAYEKLYDELVG